MVESGRTRWPRVGAGWYHPGMPRQEASPTYFQLTRDLWVSLVLVLPMLIVYQLGLLLIQFRVVNGADLLTQLVYPRFGVRGVVLANLIVTAIFLGAIIRLERQRRFRPVLFLPLIAESTLYASLLGSVIVFVMRKTYLLAGPLTSVVLSIGAGVNEELLFRLVLLSVLMYVFFDFFGLRESVAFAIAALFSAFAFSAAHYVGRYGDPFAAESFGYRAIAGLIFALIYRYRSFAVAVYTHSIYDIIVLAIP